MKIFNVGTVLLAMLSSASARAREATELEKQAHEVVPAVAVSGPCKLYISRKGLEQHRRIMDAAKTDEELQRLIRLLHTTWQEMYVEARNEGKKDQFCKDFIANHDYVSVKKVCKLKGIEYDCNEN